MFESSGAEKTNMRSVCVPRAALARGVLLVLLAAAAAARAQYGRPSMSDPAIGEKYHVEGVLNFVESRPRGHDLERVARDRRERDRPQGRPRLRGQADSRVPLRAAAGEEAQVPDRLHARQLHGDVVLTRTIIFNGINFTLGLPIQTEFKWNTWRFGYEYDFVYTDRGYVGFIVEARETDAELHAAGPLTTSSRAPAGRFRRIGGAAASIPSKHLSITGEFTGFKLPEINHYQGDFFDFDIYGTYNFTKNFGVAGRLPHARRELSCET